MVGAGLTDMLFGDFGMDLAVLGIRLLILVFNYGMIGDICELGCL